MDIEASSENEIPHQEVTGTQEQPKGKSGLGGLLIIPVILIAIQPVVALIEGMKAIAALNHPSSFIYWPSLVINIALVIFAFFILILYFRKRPSAPFMFIIFYILAFIIWCTTSQLLPLKLFVPKGKIVMGVHPAILPMLVSFIWSLILTPYFLFSKRVKNTFAARSDSSILDSISLWRVTSRIYGLMTRYRVILVVALPFLLLFYTVLMVFISALLRL